MKQLVLATGNAGKLAEIQRMSADLPFEILPQSLFDVPEAVENGLTFVENALLKARNAARVTGLPAIADDSGLEVPALGGAPGIYSSRYAGPEGDAARNIARLLRELAAVDDEEQRRASFRCLMVYLRHADDPAPLLCQGIWSGRIAFSAEGAGGFGYDPIFWVPERGCSAAALSAEEKDQLSHRGQALRCLVKQLSLLL